MMVLYVPHTNILMKIIAYLLRGAAHQTINHAHLVVDSLPEIQDCRTAGMPNISHMSMHDLAPPLALWFLNSFFYFSDSTDHGLTHIAEADDVSTA